MNILVNGTPLLAPLTGIGQYIRHLFTAMDQLPEAEITMYYGMRCEKGPPPTPVDSSQAVQYTNKPIRRLIPRPRIVRHLAEKAFFAYQARKNSGNTLYHEPNYIPLPYNGPLVLTICDLSCFDHPETHPEERVRLMQRKLPPAIAKADHIIVISEASGAALKEWFGVAPEKITTTYLAADPRFQPHPIDHLRPQLATLGLTPKEYVLCVGTLEPRKNLTTLFAAYAGLPIALRKRYPLAVAGMSGWHTQPLLKSAEELIRRGELRLLGYVADELIPPLYAGAAAFAYPSRYEGFGLPVLEAMASGIPVLTTNQTSLPEVVGDAGLMVDPDDIDGMREALRKMLESRDFASNLAQKGLTRAQTFSWNRCARETFSVYEKVMKNRGLLR